MIAAFGHQNRGVGWQTRVAYLDRKPSQDRRIAILFKGDRQRCSLVRFRQRAMAGSTGLRDASSFEPEAPDLEVAEITHGVGLGPISPNRYALDDWANGLALLLTDDGRILRRQAVLRFLRTVCVACAGGSALTGRLTITRTPARDRPNRVPRFPHRLTSADRLRDLPARNCLDDPGAAR